MLPPEHRCAESFFAPEAMLICCDAVNSQGLFEVCCLRKHLQGVHVWSHALCFAFSGDMILCSQYVSYLCVCYNVDKEQRKAEQCKVTDNVRSHTSRANHNRAPTTAKDTHKGNNKIQGHNTLAIPPQIASCPLTNLRCGSGKPRGVTSPTHSHKATSHRPLNSSVAAAQTDKKFAEHAGDKLLAHEGAVAVLASPG
jgi:hypothetical protein